MSDLVTAIVAAYDEARHIRACLDSLRSQTHAPLEILVADDGSRDKTAEIASGVPGVRVLRLPHAGKARAINAAAREARGTILLFLDADLIFDPRYVEALVAPILAGDAVGTSHATERVANPRNVWSRCLQARQGLPPDLRISLSPEQIVEGSTIYRAIRKDAFAAVGGFDDAGYLDDQTLFPKVGRRGRFVVEAVCSHQNPDRLREVFASGVWAGKTVHARHGSRAALRVSPPSAVVRAVIHAARQRLPALAVFDTVYETGVFWGLVKRATGLDRTVGA